MKRFSLGTAVYYYRNENVYRLGIVVKKRNDREYYIKWFTSIPIHNSGWLWYPEEYIKNNYVII